MRRGVGAGLLLAAAVLTLLAVASAASAGTYSGGTIFAGGAPERTLFESSCGTPDTASSIRLPFDANVSGVGLDVGILPASNASSGWFVAEVSGFGTPANATVAGTTHVNILGAGFNEYLINAGASSGVVDVPLTFRSCPSGSNWTLRLYNVSVVLIDNDAPTVVISNPSDGFGIGANEFDIQLDATAFDTRAGFPYNASYLQVPAYLTQVSTDGVAWSTATVTASAPYQVSFSFLFQGLQEDVTALYVRVGDLAGNAVTRQIPVVIDRTAPIITILEPSQSSMATNSQTVRVSAETEAGTLIFVNGLEPPEVFIRPDMIHVYFSMDVPVFEGPNTITVAVIDALNNQAEAYLLVLVDLQPPYLSVAWPTPDLLVNRSPLVVSGQSETTGVVVSVNGVQVPQDASGNWSAAVTLVEGPNRLNILASDLAGNTQLVVRDVTLDLTPPQLTIAGPSGTILVNRSTYTVLGTVSEASTVMVGGSAVNASTQAFSASVNLVEGPNLVLVEAVDGAGNHVALVLTIVRDTSAPSFEIDQPTTPQVLTNRTTLRVVVLTTNEATAGFVSYEDDLGHTVAAQVELTPGPGASDRTLEYILPLVSDGLPHLVTVAVEDAVHNRGSRTFTYTSRITPPTLNLAPLPLAQFGATVWVNGTTDAEVESVDVNGVSYPVADGHFSILLALPAGADALPIVVVVVDAAGNRADYNAGVARLGSSTDSYLGLGAASGDRPPVAGSSVQLWLQHAERVPAHSNVTWFVDGVAVGTGLAVNISALAAGDHTVGVLVDSPQGPYSESFTLSVAPSSTLAPGGFPAALAVLLLSLGVAGAVIGGTERGRYFVLFALIGYVMGRRKPASPLDHFVRGRLYQVIAENPGIHFSELRRRANVSNGNASHHLHVLVRAGLVRPLVDRTLTRFYPTDRPLDDESYGLSDSDRAVLAAVEGTPGLTETQISERVNRSLSVVSRSVDRLGALGHIRTEQNGRVVSVFPRPAPETGIGEPSPPSRTA